MLKLAKGGNNKVGLGYKAQPDVISSRQTSNSLLMVRSCGVLMSNNLPIPNNNPCQSSDIVVENIFDMVLAETLTYHNPNSEQVLL